MFDGARDLAKSARDRNEMLGALDQQRPDRNPKARDRRWHPGTRMTAALLIVGVLTGLAVLLGLLAIVRR